MTLTEFLLARIAEDEAAAKAATAGPWETQTMAGNLVYGNPEVGDFVCNTGAVTSERVLDDALHIARHDPARVLAECEAKRQIVELHTDGHRCDWGDWYQPGECETRVLRILAGVYADHPDYDAEWVLRAEP